jgi:hypothetical protein
LKPWLQRLTSLSVNTDMKRHGKAAGVFSLIVGVLACAPRIDGPEEVDAGQLDAGQLDAGQVDAGSRPSVGWLDKPGPVRITTDKSLRYAFRYFVDAAGENLTRYALTVETCAKKAGLAESCSITPADPQGVAPQVLFDIDPSNYRNGDNLFRFALRLSLNGTLVSEDAFSLPVQVENCQRCM